MNTTPIKHGAWWLVVMLSERSRTLVPSRNALRVLRQLALAGSTLTSVCTLAAVTYDINRRVAIAERLVESKRTLQTSAPYYDATTSAQRLAMMIEAAEEGEFEGLASLKVKGWTKPHPAFGEDKKKKNAEVEEQKTSAPTQPEQTGPVSYVPPKDRMVVPSIYIQQWKRLRRGEDVPPSSTAENRAESSQAAANPSETAPSSTAADNKLKEVDFNAPFGYAQDTCTNLEIIRDLLDRGQIIDAAEMFLETHPTTLRALSMESRELAKDIFYANCRANNVFTARSIFFRIDELDQVSPRMWKVLLVVLAKNGAVESAGRLYMQYRNTMKLPPFLIEVVLRCLLESHRFREAQYLMYASVQHDRNCGLCGLFLTGLWKKTHNIDLINQQLIKLLEILQRFRKRPSERLFNPVMKAYVECGRAADAEALAKDMEARYGIAPNCRTKGILLQAKAFACDWEAVEQGLDEMHELGMTKDESFIPAFDRVFLEYWPTHSVNAIRNFFYNAVEKYSLVPDKVLYRHVLEAFVEKGNEDLVAELQEFAKARGWDIDIDHNEFMETLRSRRLAQEKSPAGFWQMLQAARVKYGQVAATQQILGFDQRSVPLEEVNLMPHTNEVPPWYERTMESVTLTRAIDQHQPLDRQLSRFLHAGNLEAALEAFQRAQVAGYRFSGVHIELALIATLLERGLPAAKALVEEHMDSIRQSKPFSPKFFQQVLDCEPDSEIEVIKLAIFRFYSLCWENPSLLVKHHLMNSTAAKLIKKGQHSEALDLLVTAYKSRWGRRDRFNGTCMKTFVRAFGALDHFRGVRWCILTGITRGSAVSPNFLAEIRRVLASLRLRSPPGRKEKMRRRKAYLRYLETLADILEKKASGDPELKALRVDRLEKLKARRLRVEPTSDDRALCDFASIRRTIEAWDEEMELDKLTNPDHGKLKLPRVKELWNEVQVVGEEFCME